MDAVGVIAVKAITSRGERLAFPFVADLRIGIDIGGSGIKGAVVDVDSGTLVSDRLRVDTPEPSHVAAVARVTAAIIEDLESPDLAIGVGFPAVIRSGTATTANNIEPEWIGASVSDAILDALGRPVTVMNDADVAGLAEVRFGAAKGVGGTVIVLTFGTGIGSALIVDGDLVPNVELGQIEYRGVIPAESIVSAKARKTRGLTWDEWGREIADYIGKVSDVINPNLVILGGGAVRKWDLFSAEIPSELNVVRAELSINAGIIGAALIAG